GRVPVNFTRAEKHACALRELNLRRRNYPRFIQIGRLTPGDADREIALMQAIVDDYRDDLFVPVSGHSDTKEPS
ncbi:MAG: hypothetical protein KAX54_00070, partial [Thauera sp.]|nr:hypothetical protein [Thauera sp.]